MTQNTQIEAKLAPCPFCGSAGNPKVFDFDGEPYVPGYEVRCDASGWEGMDERGCGASSGWGETPAEAIAAWNRRALREAPVPSEEPVAAFLRDNPLKDDAQRYDGSGDLADEIGSKIEAMLSGERQGAFIGLHQVRAIKEIQGRIRSALASPAVAPVAVSVKATWGDSGPIPGHHCGDEFDAATPQTDAVKIKSLEWTEDEENWYAATPQLPQSYEVRTTLRGVVRTRTERRSFEDFNGTVDEAKAAAQADFNARILSSIIPATKGGELEALREALFAELGEPDYKLARWSQASEPFHYWSRESIDNALVTVRAALAQDTAATPPSDTEEKAL